MRTKTKRSSKIRSSFHTLLMLAAVLPLASAQTDSAPSARFAGKVRLVLPPVLYAVANLETNIYFDNVVLAPNSADYVFDVKCEKGLIQADRWSYTPGADEAGSFPLVLEVRDAANAVIARAQSTLQVARQTSGAGVPTTLLVVGDSLTQASIYTEHLLQLASSASGPALTLIGSRGPDNSPAHGPNRHEGYSGWSAQAFATFNGPLSRTGEFKGRETGSPFVYQEGEKLRLDFAKYCQQFNQGKAPDFVTFALGTNDIFYGTDDNIDHLIDQILGHFDALIGMVRALDRSTKIGLFLVIPPSSSQDGFQHYRGTQRQTRWQYRRDQHRTVERMIERYGGHEQENIYLVPTYTNLDAAHNFPARSSSWNAENTEVAPRVIDGIHPAPAGYRQMGDMVYCWMKTLLPGKPR